MILQLADYNNTPLYSKLLSALDDKGVSSVVYAVQNNLTAPAADREVLMPDREFKPLTRLMYFPKQNYIFKDIEKRIDISNIQLTHAHTLFSSGYIAYKLYRKYGIPYITAVRNTDVNVFFKYMKHLIPLGLNILQNARETVFISPAYKTHVLNNIIPDKQRKHISDRSVVIPNGIDRHFLEHPLQHKQDSKCIRLIYVGKLMQSKNIQKIIDVCDKLTADGNNVHLTLVGEVLDERLYHTIQTRNYASYYPKTDSEGVKRYMQDNDIFIMPSFAETFGLVYAEAISQGLPVIYTRGQGFDGWFEDGKVGYAVNPHDTAEIAARVSDISARYDEFSNNCKNVAQRFDWQKIADIYAGIYSQNKR